MISDESADISDREADGSSEEGPLNGCGMCWYDEGAIIEIFQTGKDAE